jgi:hypothetical protein
MFIAIFQEQPFLNLFQCLSYLPNNCAPGRNTPKFNCHGENFLTMSGVSPPFSVERQLVFDKAFEVILSLPFHKASLCHFVG